MTAPSLYGPDLRDHGWVPAPRYVLRRHRVLDAIQHLQPQSVLEVGCGPGALLLELARRGLRCEALETSGEARKLAAILHDGVDTSFHAQPQAAWSGSFDLVMACEVLEHIDDDLGALRTWVEWIRPGGHMLVSVPAHAHQWNATDTWAGHVRRYERTALKTLLREAGLTVLRFESYGVPLANIIEPVRARVHQRQLAEDGLRKPGDATARSGTRRSVESRLYPLQDSPPGRLIMQTFIRLQRLFLGTDLGRGYLAVARKATAPAPDETPP